MSATYAALCRAVGNQTARRALDRAADLAVADRDPATGAIMLAANALGDPDHTYIHKNGHLWIMKTRDWNSLTRSLTKASEEPSDGPSAAPAPTPSRPRTPVSERLLASAGAPSARGALSESAMEVVTPSGVKSPVPVNGNRLGSKPREFVQFGTKGGVLSPNGPTVESISPGLYRIGRDHNYQPIFIPAELNSDSILRFEDARYQNVLGQIDGFWNLREAYAEMGTIHKRGVMLFGPPGSGKSCLLKLVMEDAMNRGNIVLLCDDTDNLSAALGPLRQVEPDRQVLAILEDVEEMREHGLLQLLDGDNTADNILYLATTNYIERIAPRVMRPGRFDTKVEIGPPPSTGRRAFLENKIMKLHPELDLESMVKATEGFSFGQMREYVIRIHCFRETPETAAAGLANGGYIYESRDHEQRFNLLVG